MGDPEPLGPEVTAAVAKCVRPADVFRRAPPVDMAIIERVTRTACRDYRDVLQGMAYPEVLHTLETLGLPR